MVVLIPGMIRQIVTLANIWQIFNYDRFLGLFFK